MTSFVEAKDTGELPDIPYKPHPITGRTGPRPLGY